MEAKHISKLIREMLPVNTKFYIDVMAESISRRTVYQPCVIKARMIQMLNQKYEPIVEIDKLKGIYVYKPVLKKRVNKGELDNELVKAINFIHSREGFNFIVCINDAEEKRLPVTTEDCFRK